MTSASAPVVSTTAARTRQPTSSPCHPPSWAPSPTVTPCAARPSRSTTRPRARPPRVSFRTSALAAWPAASMCRRSCSRSWRTWMRGVWRSRGTGPRSKQALDGACVALLCCLRGQAVDGASRPRCLVPGPLSLSLSPSVGWEGGDGLTNFLSGFQDGPTILQEKYARKTLGHDTNQPGPQTGPQRASIGVAMKIHHLHVGSNGIFYSLHHEVLISFTLEDTPAILTL